MNGEPLELPEPLTVAALLARLDIDARRVAVEHNLTIVKRDRYISTIVEEGDAIEIVNFVGGGSGGSRRRMGNGKWEMGNSGGHT